MKVFSCNLVVQHVLHRVPKSSVLWTSLAKKNHMLQNHIVIQCNTLFGSSKIVLLSSNKMNVCHKTEIFNTHTLILKNVDSPIRIRSSSTLTINEFKTYFKESLLESIERVLKCVIISSYFCEKHNQITLKENQVMNLNKCG